MSLEPAASVSNGVVTILNSTGATLSGSFSQASARPSEVGFYWGTSSSEMSKVVGQISQANQDADGKWSGSFSATINNAVAGRTNVAQAYAEVSGTGSYATQSIPFYAPQTIQFVTENVTPAVNKTWLELPSAKDEDEMSSNRYVVNTTYSGERNYTVFYDTQTMTPLWTAYPLESSHMGNLDRPSTWSYNPGIQEKYQASVISSSYSGSTYSRGHMCPNASRNGNKTMQEQTFYVTNQVPQIQNSFNSGIWSNLEKAVQDLAQNEEIFVVTGVALNKVGENKTVNKISDNSGKQVSIPNYFYKLVLRVKYSGNTVTDAIAIGFWFEHKAYTKDSYANYKVSIDQVEEWTGFNFFVNLPDEIEREVEAQTITWDQFSTGF